MTGYSERRDAAKRFWRDYGFRRADLYGLAAALIITAVIVEVFL